MNILHLHLSDWGGFRLEVPGLSELTNDLNGQYYTLQDARDLVNYATKRGIRIIAEVRSTFRLLFSSFSRNNLSRGVRLTFHLTAVVSHH